MSIYAYIVLALLTLSFVGRVMRIADMHAANQKKENNASSTFGAIVVVVGVRFLLAWALYNGGLR